jgi:hypothetical protein
MSGSQLIVVDTTNLDYETTSGYTLVIEVMDGILRSTGSVSIDLINVNDNAPVVADDSATIGENATTGTIVLTVSCTDADGDTISYTITAGNDGGIFGMSGDQLVVVDTANLDFELVSGYVLTVQ